MTPEERADLIRFLESCDASIHRRPPRRSVPSRPLLASLTGRRSGRCLGHCPDPSRGPCAPPRSARWRRSRSRPGCPPTWAARARLRPDPRWPGWRRHPNRWTPRWAPGARAARRRRRHARERRAHRGWPWRGPASRIHFGPLVQANRYERLAFWPDTRGVMPRQVQAAIAAQDPEADQARRYGRAQRALQGLPALEYDAVRRAGAAQARRRRTSPMPAAMPARCPPTCPASRAIGAGLERRRRFRPPVRRAQARQRPVPAMRRKWRPRPSRRCPPACSSRAT